MSNKFADDLQQDLANGHVLDWAEMYALDAVSEEERTTLEVYISGTDPGVRDQFDQRVRAAREAISRAYAVDEAEPPAELLDRIMRQLPDAEATQKFQSAAPVDEIAARRSSSRSRKSSPVARWLVAAAAAIVVAVGGVTVAQNLQTGSLEQEVLQASDVQRTEISIPAGGTADLAFSTAEDAAVVTLKGVPAPPQGKVYQMWRLPSDGTSPQSIGTMSSDDVSGTPVTAVDGISAFRGLAITVEPEGGSATPTMPLLAQIPFDV
ncbi:anti-sigma factor [Arthrobacter sp. H5]|uniref:anti-sigma factor n=1 Tax=Arthrobacter sp. H5 TaxID=1267973 RepID=UPI00138B1727|nr:anti-sigma factor [Arthrobacter sp. H5]